MSAALCACGVVAIGRCVVCDNAYCMSHGDMDYPYGVPVPAQSRCAKCGGKARAERAAQETAIKEAQQQKLDNAKRRIKQAASALLERGYPAAQERKKPQHATFAHLAPAWPVGEFSWLQDIPRSDTNNYNSLLTGVTPDGDIVPLKGAGRWELSNVPGSQYFPQKIRYLGLQQYELIADALEAHLSTPMPNTRSQSDSDPEPEARQRESRWHRLKKLIRG